MLSKPELIAQIRSMTRTMGALTIESGIIHNDMCEMIVEVLNDELKYGGLLYHRLWQHRDKLELILSWLNRDVNLLTEKGKNNA